MKTRRSFQVLVGITAVAGLAACGGGSSPTQQPTTQSPVAAPTPTPTPSAPVGIVLPAGMVCDPTPPPILGLKAEMWRPRGDGGWVLDSSPIVPNIENYCDRAGFGAWKFCFTRPEGDPQREACDYLAVGKASDTGRWGPTWTLNGKPCDGTGDCLNSPENQFKAIAKGPGRYEACISPLGKVYQGSDPYPGSRCGYVDVP